MVAVAAGESEVVPLLTEGVEIAAINSPNAVVISGAAAPVGAAADLFAQRGKRVHQLAVSLAAHSALIDPILDQFAQLVAEVKPGEPRIGLVSTMSGQLAGPGYGTARYWLEHVRRPVRFVDAVRTAESLGPGCSSKLARWWSERGGGAVPDNPAAGGCCHDGQRPT